jgi:hypothetical protein
MQSKRDVTYIKSFINSTQKDFDELWNVLVLIKSRQIIDKDSINSLFSFQCNLADLLYKIEEEFQIVTKIQNDLKKNKNSTEKNEYLLRKNEGEKLKTSLTTLLYIGKSLGDAFVWLFYGDDKEMLESHLKEPEHVHSIPTTLGGRSEIEFIRKLKILNNQFVIYHNITNILRLGDVSLFDIENKRLSGIGDLKSHKKENGEISINLHVRAHKSVIVMPSKNTKIQSKETEPNVLDKNRYEKQMSRISESFKFLNNPTESVKKKITIPSYYPDLEKTINENKGGFTFTKIDKGLIVGCYRLDEETLADRILAEESINKNKIDEKYIPIINSINSEINNFRIYGGMQIKDGVKTNYMLGLQPLFWQRIENNILKQIYFANVLIFTVYNPSFLISEIEKMGFSLSENKKELTKIIDGKIIRLTGIDYFLRMIHDYLYHEQIIIESIKETLDSLEKKGIKKNTVAKIVFNG